MNILILKNPFVSAFISGTIITLLFFIDSKIIKKKKEKKEYIKIFLFVSLIVGILIHIMNIHKLFVENKVLKKVEPVVKEVKKTLDTGIADF
tara:strand:- start:898 stop:1173 length:276 start_codon:yes stop_codon:yes gene_type:complete